MYDPSLAIDILNQVYHAVGIILKRFEPVQSPDDFTKSEYGMEKLDAICMQLITIGESLKNLDKITEKNLLKNYPQIEWKKIKGLQDIITHHYFDVNAEAIYNVCDNHIEPLGETIKQIINELSSG